ncbi:hypothetical protein [Hyphococcus sp.]|jgi:hypothetical protein|uniref:hypothetical protein n=1 Tax=Hyphococcus sp. TaxID=2038636 RepID=UPI003D126999
MSTNPRFTYHCYGQHIHSDFPFQEMAEVETAAPDLVITGSNRFLGPPAEEQMAEFLPDRQYFDFPGVIQAEITDASHLQIALYPGAAVEMLGLPVLGPIMATVLHYKGYLVIHGSGLVMDGKLNVFIGHRGAGKSTTAACLLERGHQLFSDDLIVIDLSDPSHPMALAGYPATKVAPEIAERFHPVAAHALSNGGYAYPKERFRIVQTPPPRTMPIEAVYALERSADAALQTLDFKAALDALMQNSYMLKYGAAPMAAGRGAAHFIQVTQLATRVPVKRLKTPSTLDALHRIEPLLLGAA